MENSVLASDQPQWDVRSGQLLSVVSVGDVLQSIYSFIIPSMWGSPGFSVWVFRIHPCTDVIFEVIVQTVSTGDQHKLEYNE